MANKVNRDAKLHRSGEVRKERESKSREILGNRELSDAERLDALRASTFQTQLPNLPPIDGYHVCWLTTANSRDPIHGRLRLGYELIKAHEVPGFEHATVKSGEFEGCINVNEMVAAKLPMHLYEAYMKELHHDQPLAEEENIRKTAEEAIEKAKQVNRNARLTAESGTEDLGRAPPPPTFAEYNGET